MTNKNPVKNFLFSRSSSLPNEPQTFYGMIFNDLFPVNNDVQSLAIYQILFSIDLQFA